MHHAEQHFTRERLPRRTVDSATLGHCRPAAVNQARRRGCGTDSAEVTDQPRCGDKRRREAAESGAVAADNREDRRRLEEIHHCLHPLSQRFAKCEYRS